MKNVPSAQPGDMVRVRDQLWRVCGLEPGQGCVAWRLEGLDDRNGGRTFTVLTPFDSVARVQHRRFRRVRWCAWHTTVADLLARAQPAEALRAPALARLRLLPYQCAPTAAVVADGHLRVLIADAVGLGKTLQAGLLLRELGLRHSLRRALVVVPAGLVDQWVVELERGLGLAVAKVSWAELRDRQQSAPGVHPWAHDAISIVSLDFLRQPEVAHGVRDIDWDVVIVDEAHLVSTASQRTDAVSMVAARSMRVILLSATPHSGDAFRFDALRAVGSHGGGGDEMVVFRRTRSFEGRSTRRASRLRVRLHDTERHLFALLDAYIRAVWEERPGVAGRAARLAMLVLRKRAYSGPWPLLQSVRQRLASLEGSIERADEAARLPFEAMAHDDLPSVWLSAPGLTRAGRERAWLGAISHAARAALPHHGKLRVLRKLMARAREPVIVFTEYRDSLEHMARALGREHAVAMLHGGLAGEARAAALDAFSRGRARVLMATDAASEGLNLHDRCRWVIHVELPWSPTRLEQRTGRVDRLGQTRRVHATSLVAEGTGEVSLIARLEERRARIAAALDTRAQPVSVPRARAAAPAAGTVETSAGAVAGEQTSRLRAGMGPRWGADILYCEVSRRAAWRRRVRSGQASTTKALAVGFYYVMGVPVVARGVVVEDAALAVHVALAARTWPTPRALRALMFETTSRVWTRLEQAAVDQGTERASQVGAWLERVDTPLRARAAHIRRLVDESRPRRQASLFEGTRWDPHEGEAAAVFDRAAALGESGASTAAAPGAVRDTRDLDARDVRLGTPRLLAVLAVRP